MGLFKKFTGFLGFSKDEEFENPQQNAESNTNSSPYPSELPPFANNNNPNRRGFSVPVQVPVDRGPIFVQCSPADGGIQGLRWFARRLKIDEDGDVADEFLEEVLLAIHEKMDEDHIPVTKMEKQFVARPAKIRNQVLSPEGKLQHYVENQGRLQWV